MKLAEETLCTKRCILRLNILLHMEYQRLSIPVSYTHLVTFLKRNEKSALLYVFRPDRLEKDLSQPAVQNVLKTFGYTDYKVGASIKHLKQRVGENTCFPHEIGLFLSYPVEDVIQFIRQKGCNYKCCGVWKVYCDEAFCQKMFCLLYTSRCV